MQQEARQQPARIRPYTLKELSSLYGISTRTILRWLNPFKTQIGERNGRFYTILQVGKIFELLGMPDDSW